MMTAELRLGRQEGASSERTELGASLVPSGNSKEARAGLRWSRGRGGGRRRSKRSLGPDGGPFLQSSVISSLKENVLPPKVTLASTVSGSSYAFSRR